MISLSLTEVPLLPPSLKVQLWVTSISAGIGVSLLPNITSDFAVNNLEGVREKTSKIITMLLIIVIPMVMGLSVLSKPVWTVFYGASQLGSTVFKISIFTALFCSLFNCIMIIMQSINIGAIESHIVVHVI